MYEMAAEPSTTLGFAEWLRGQMADRRWKQGDLAREARVSQQTASRWLLGRSVPARGHLNQLAHALGISVEELLARCEQGSSDTR